MAESPNDNNDKDMREGALDGSSNGSSNPTDVDLGRVIAAWPSLPAPLRAAMLALIQSAASTTGNAPGASGRANNG